MRRAILIAMVLCCVGAGGADAVGNGNELYEFCQKPDSSVMRGVCGGYVTGVSDALRASGSFCWPQGGTRGQVIDVVTIYLRDHPEKRHLLAFDLVSAALMEKFPCN